MAYQWDRVTAETAAFGPHWHAGFSPMMHQTFQRFEPETLRPKAGCGPQAPSIGSPFVIVIPSGCASQKSAVNSSRLSFLSFWPILDMESRPRSPGPHEPHFWLVNCVGQRPKLWQNHQKFHCAEIFLLVIDTQ